jgi:hypothetical protein
MLIKLGKQVKLPADAHFTIKYGTINALEPKAIFVSIHSWATPKHNLRFDRKLRHLTHSVKDKIHDEINYKVFHEKYIADFDLRASGLRKNKQSFLAIEITLYPRTVIPFPSDIYDSNITTMVNNILADVKKNKHFTFTSKKLK